MPKSKSNKNADTNEISIKLLGEQSREMVREREEVYVGERDRERKRDRESRSLWLSK